MRSPGLGGKHAQNPRPTSNIKHRLAFEKMRVVDDRGSVGSRSDGILQHLLVNAYSTHRNHHHKGKASDHTRKIKVQHIGGVRTGFDVQAPTCDGRSRWSLTEMCVRIGIAIRTKKDQHPNLGYQYRRVIATLNKTKRAFSKRNGGRQTY